MTHRINVHNLKMICESHELTIINFYGTKDITHAMCCRKAKDTKMNETGIDNFYFVFSR